MAAHTHEHGHSTFAYYVVYAILMLGLVATVWVAYHDFGAAANVIAMGIATFKAVLVVWIFMHVREASKMIWITICSGLVGLAIGFIFLFCDYAAR